MLVNKSIVYQLGDHNKSCVYQTAMSGGNFSDVNQAGNHNHAKVQQINGNDVTIH